MTHRMKTPILSPFLALLPILVALLVLLGWALDIAALKQGLASSVATNPATAVCLALLSLEAARMGAWNAHPALAKAGQLAILLVIAAALTKFCDLIFGSSFAVDQIFFGATLEAESRYPSRMAPNTAACLVLLGVALQVMRGGTDRRLRIAQLIAVLVLLAGLLAFAGNLFNARELAGPLQYIPMAFNTALAVCFIATSILSFNPQAGLLKAINWQSLQTRMTLSSMVIFVIGIWSIALYSNSLLRDELEHELGVQQFSTASLLAQEITYEVDARFSALETIAGEITPAMLANATGLQRLLQGRPIFTRLFNDGVFITALDGISIAAFPLAAQRRGADHASSNFMIAALKEGKRAVGQPILDGMLQAPIVSMAVTILNPEGKIIGALVGVTNLERLSFLSRITSARVGTSGDYLLTAKKERLIIASSNKKRLMTRQPAPGIMPALDRYFEGAEGTDVFINPLGVEILAATVQIPVAGWILAAILPTAEAFSPIRVLNQRYLLSASLLTLLAGVLTWWMMQRQFAPLRATVSALTALKDTNQPILTLTLTRQDEVGTLIRAFNGLLVSLAQRGDALQAATAQRAAEQAAAIKVQRQARIVALNLLDEARAAREQAEAASATLTERNVQLDRFNKLAVDRELEMIGLKRQINALARELERTEPFNLAFADALPIACNEAKDSSPPAAGVKK